MYNEPENSWTSLINVVLYCALSITIFVIFPFAFSLIPAGSVTIVVFCRFTAAQKSPAAVLLILSGLPLKLTKISDVLAFGPLIQYFRILSPINSVTRRNPPSALTATPAGPWRPFSNTLTCLVLGSYFSNLPVESPIETARKIWLQNKQ